MTIKNKIVRKIIKRMMMVMGSYNNEINMATKDKSTKGH